MPYARQKFHKQSCNSRNQQTPNLKRKRNSEEHEKKTSSVFPCPCCKKEQSQAQRSVLVARNTHIEQKEQKEPVQASLQQGFAYIQALPHLEMKLRTHEEVCTVEVSHTGKTHCGKIGCGPVLSRKSQSQRSNTKRKRSLGPHRDRAEHEALWDDSKIIHVNKNMPWPVS